MVGDVIIVGILVAKQVLDCGGQQAERFYKGVARLGYLLKEGFGLLVAFIVEVNCICECFCFFLVNDKVVCKFHGYTSIMS